jgi:magnesium transporter
MQASTLEPILEQLQAALRADDLARAAAIIEALRAPDQADLLSELDEAAQVALLPRLNPADSADILEELDEREAAELAASLGTETLVRIVDAMEPDEAADLLGDMTPAQMAAVLARLEDADELRPLLLHPDDSSGGLMTSAYLALRRRMTVSEVLAALRAWKPEAELVNELFVVDAFGRLQGVVSLRALVLADPTTLVGELMDPDIISVSVGADREEAARLLARYDLLALPVVDDEHRLVGVITVDDVIEVLEEETTEDIQRLGGAQPLEQPYLETAVSFIMRKRIGWLLLLFVTASLTGSVLRLFEKELDAAVVLTIFIPLLIGTGGNAGSQTTSTIIRALAVGDIDLTDALRTFWHEARVGLLLGVAMAVVAYLRAILWQTGIDVALTVALAIFTIVLWSNSLGAILPLLASRLGIDPTAVSGPAMSTLVDATGLFIYLTIARAMLGL